MKIARGRRVFEASEAAVPHVGILRIRILQHPSAFRASGFEVLGVWGFGVAGFGSGL